jgi:hypothetical protein
VVLDWGVGRGRGSPEWLVDSEADGRRGTSGGSVYTWSPELDFGLGSNSG